LVAAEPSRRTREVRITPRRMPPPFAMTLTFLAATAYGVAAIAALFRAPAGQTPMALFVPAFALASVGLWLASHVDRAIERTRCALARRASAPSRVAVPGPMAIRVAASR
jgi:hypothetical protein